MKRQRRPDLTDRQRQVLEYVQSRLDELDPPTFREIAAHFGVHINAIATHLSVLEEKGYITKNIKARSIRTI